MSEDSWGEPSRRGLRFKQISILGMSFVLLVVHKISAYCISGGTFIIYFQWVKSVLVPGWMDGRTGGARGLIAVPYERSACVIIHWT